MLIPGYRRLRATASNARAVVGPTRLAGVYCERSKSTNADPLSSGTCRDLRRITYQNGVIRIRQVIPQAMLLAGLHVPISALFGWGRSKLALAGNSSRVRELPLAVRALCGGSAWNRGSATGPSSVPGAVPHGAAKDIRDTALLSSGGAEGT